MSRRLRLGLVLAGLLGVSAVLHAGLSAAWRHGVIGKIERRLGVALGHGVVVGWVLPGWRGLTARDVRIAGAAPFEQGMLARAARIELSMGNRAAGVPAEISVDGFEVDYLRSAGADNLGGRFSDATSRSTTARALPAVQRVRAEHGRVRMFVDTAAGRRLAARLDDVSLEQGPDGPAMLRARHAVVELLGTASLEMSSVFIELAGTLDRGAFHGDAAQLKVPGAEPVLDGLQVEGRFDPEHFSVDVRRGSPGREGSVALRLDGGRRSAIVAVDGYGLPLASLRPLLSRAGVDVEHAQSSLHGVAELDAERSRVLFELDVQAERLGVHHRALDAQPWPAVGVHAHLRGDVELEPSVSIRLRPSRVELLGVPVSLEGSWQISPPGPGQLAVATGDRGPHSPQAVDCAGLLAQQAAPVRAALAGLELDGAVRASASVGFVASPLEVTSVNVRFAELCRVAREPAALESIGLLSREVVYNRRDEAGRERPFALGLSNSSFVQLRDIPRHVQAAFTTAEDYSFRSHRGFDVEMIRRATNHDLRTSSFGKGASTISQQLAKNLFLRPDRNLARKLEEAVYTWRLESLLSKDRILELYLNAIELGPGIHGVKDAARAYFGKPLALLTPLEAAHLAALAPNPRVYARQFREGHIDPAWLRHLDEILVAMQRRHMLQPGTLRAAQAASLPLHGL